MFRCWQENKKKNLHVGPVVRYCCARLICCCPNDGKYNITHFTTLAMNSSKEGVPDHGFVQVMNLVFFSVRFTIIICTLASVVVVVVVDAIGKED